MKKYFLVHIFSLVTSLVYSQSFAIKDTAIGFNLDFGSISFSPTTPISELAYTFLNFKDGRKGIEFLIVSKKRSAFSSIRLDSIILKSTSGKKVILNQPKRDTALTRSDGGLSLAVILFLSKENQLLLKTEAVESIILVVDKKELMLKLNKVSQLDILKTSSLTF